MFGNKLTTAQTRRSQRPKPLRVLRFRMLAFFAVFGPGFITANVDNDPGGIESCCIETSCVRSHLLMFIDIRLMSLSMFTSS